MTIDFDKTIFERVERDCAANARRKAKGATRGIIYDFVVRCTDGPPAKFLRIDAAFSTQYELLDGTGRAVPDPDRATTGNKTMLAESQSDFLRVYCRAVFNKLLLSAEEAQQYLDKKKADAEKKRLVFLAFAKRERAREMATRMEAALRLIAAGQQPAADEVAEILRYIDTDDTQ